MASFAYIKELFENILPSQIYFVKHTIVYNYLRLWENEINFVFCERVLYVGTALEQKTESAKNGKDSMSLAFLQSLRVQQVAPTSLCKGGKKVYLLYSARFSHFIKVC